MSEIKGKKHSRVNSSLVGKWVEIPIKKEQSNDNDETQYNENNRNQENNDKYSQNQITNKQKYYITLNGGKKNVFDEDNENDDINQSQNDENGQLNKSGQDLLDNTNDNIKDQNSQQEDNDDSNNSEKYFGMSVEAWKICYSDWINKEITLKDWKQQLEEEHNMSIKEIYEQKLQNKYGKNQPKVQQKTIKKQQIKQLKKEDYTKQDENKTTQNQPLVQQNTSQNQYIEDEDKEEYRNYETKPKTKNNDIFQYYTLPDQVSYEELDISQYLKVKQTFIQLFKTLPGQILEREVELENLSSENIVVNISIDDTYEGILQIYNRNQSQNQLMDDNEENQNQNKPLQILIAGNSNSSFDLVINTKKGTKSTFDKKNLDTAIRYHLEKFPPKNQEKNQDIKQELNEYYDDIEKKIQLKVKEDNNEEENNQEENLKNNQNDEEEEEKQEKDNEQPKKEIVSYVVPNLIIPTIKCPKSMMMGNQRVIKLACKLMQPQTEMRVSFQVTNYTSIIAMEFLEDIPNNYIQIKTRPMTTIVDYNGFFMINIVMRPNYANLKDGKVKSVNKILLLKLQNTSMVFSFPINIEIY